MSIHHVVRTSAKNMDSKLCQQTKWLCIEIQASCDILKSFRLDLSYGNLQEIKIEALRNPKGVHLAGPTGILFILVQSLLPTSLTKPLQNKNGQSNRMLQGIIPVKNKKSSQGGMRKLKMLKLLIIGQW